VSSRRSVGSSARPRCWTTVGQPRGCSVP